MCWNLPVSIGMAALGGGASIISRRRGAPTAIWVALAFFASMEALQAAGYLVINACGTPANRVITFLSFLHIAIQPIFINAISLELIPAEIRARIRAGVYFICGACVVLTLAQLLPLEWAGVCRVPETMCASGLCTRSGDWHIAWDIPLNGLGTSIENILGVNWGLPFYMLATFVMPFAYGSWRFTIFHLLLGPIAANALTSQNNEVPAIWCLFSIGIVALAFFPPMIEWFRVKSWPLWPGRWRSASAAA